MGCGCRGRSLARLLIEDGHAVRGTTRDPARRAEIEAVGAECFIGDPDRIGTLTAALSGATVLCWLLGSATGPTEQQASLHGSRLEMLLSRTIDTTVRGFVYEAAGTVDQTLLRQGADSVVAACERSRIPHALLSADPRGLDAWLAAARGAVRGLLAG